MRVRVDRWAEKIAAAMLFLAALPFLWLAFVPSGLDTIFGEDEFDPLSGLVLLALTAVLSFGTLKGSRRMTWGGLALAGLALLLWLWVFTTTELGISAVFLSLYAVAVAALAVSLVLSARGAAFDPPDASIEDELT